MPTLPDTAPRHPTSWLHGNAPAASSAGVSARMRSQRRRDTRPEVELRSRLHAAGLRFRVDMPVAELPRHRMDIAFPRVRFAAYVDGCFWHSCPVHRSRPRSNSAWWQEKLARNAERDRETTSALRAAGWTVLRYWEHDDPDDAAYEVRCAYEQLCLQTRQRAAGGTAT